MKNLYNTHGSDMGFLSNPLPNSFVVDATQNRARNRLASTPNNKEDRKLEMLGRRIYSLASFILRVVNSSAAMEAYHCHLWNAVFPALQATPEDLRTSSLACHQETMTLTRQERIAAPHIVDAITLRRHAWLHSASISEDARSMIEDLPFDKVGLFDQIQMRFWTISSSCRKQLLEQLAILSEKFLASSFLLLALP